MSPQHSDTAFSLRLALEAFLLGSTIFLLQFVFWYFHVRGYYHVEGDDFSMMVHSTRFFGVHSAEWFTQGFARYFMPYPDISVSITQFIRPVDNAVFYLSSMIFVRHWGAYLLANYAIVASLCATVFVIARGVLRMPVGITAVVIFAVAVSPAYTEMVLYSPAFAFDYLGALWALLCLVCLLRGQYVFAWLFVCLAVLSKETDFYTAPAAFLVVLLGEHSRNGWKRAIAFLLPLVGVLLLRRWDFRGTVKGPYVLAGITPKDILRNVALAGSNWLYLLPGQGRTQGTLERFHNLPTLLLDVCGWAVLGALIVHRLRNLRRDGLALDPRLAILIFLLGSCLLPTALGLPLRFAACMVPLLVLEIASVQGNAARTLGYALLALLCAEGTAGMLQTFSTHLWRRQVASWELSNSLVQQLTRSERPQYLVVDQSEMYSSPDAVSVFAGSRAPLIALSSLALKTSCDGVVPVALKRDGPQIAIHYNIPANCGSYHLLNTTRVLGDSGKKVERHLTQADISYDSPTGSPQQDEYIWHSLDVHLHPKAGYRLLVPDVTAHTYRVAMESDLVGH